MPDLILASASPRRRQLLQAIGVEPEVAPAEIDETPLVGEKPEELVERLALGKARTAWERLIGSTGSTGSTAADGAEGPVGPGRLVIGADTVIDLDGRILGKPVDRSEAEAMLISLSGRSHDVLTGLAVCGRLGAEAVECSALVRSEVVIRALDPDEIAWYLDSGEPAGKAGAYAIQGLGSLLVERIEGSYVGIVGLPLTLLDRMLTDLGHPLRTFAGSAAGVLDAGAVGWAR